MVTRNFDLETKELRREQARADTSARLHMATASRLLELAADIETAIELIKAEDNRR